MMPAAWLPFFEWCEQTGLAVAMQQSLWLFPVIEAVHLLGLSLLGGAVLLLNLRLLGLGVRAQPVVQVWRDVRPWIAAGVMVMVITGVPLFLSEAVRCFYNPPFWIKMGALALAVTFTVTVQRRVVEAATDPVRRSWRMRLVGVVSLVLWTTVGAMGRGIGFY
jgi:hypothetical protein